MITVRTPCRLHFGLLALSRDTARQFGGVGLMVRRPDIAVRLSPADDFAGSGPMGERAEHFARTAAANAAGRKLTDAPRPVAVRVLRAPRSHAGLGTGTQLGMAVARAYAEYIGRPDLTPKQLAGLVDRGARSAIGAHGFRSGGLIVEGGKQSPEHLSPRLLTHPFPDEWRVVLVTPSRTHHDMQGQREKQAFRELPSIPREVTGEMCRLVLLGLLPAMLEHDLDGFGDALYELQQTVGRCFAPAQGGVYGSPLLEEIVTHVRGEGIRGIGQSSWGPTLYAVVRDDDQAEQLAIDLTRRFDLEPGDVIVTEADNEGSSIHAGQVSDTPHLAGGS